MFDLIKKILGIDLIKESREKQKEALANLSETKRLLTLNGEETWMLNICRTPKKGDKECLPNDES